jgi:hypothetical protein
MASGQVAGTKTGPRITIDFDRDADVLYIALGSPQPAESEERDKGIVLRYSVKNDAPCGVTVVGFRDHGWARRRNDLVALVAEHLGVPPEVVSDALSQALYQAL